MAEIPSNGKLALETAELRGQVIALTDCVVHIHTALATIRAAIPAASNIPELAEAVDKVEARVLALLDNLEATTYGGKNGG